MKKSKILFAGLIAATVFGFNTLSVDAVGKTYVDSFPENVVRPGYQIITFLNEQDYGNLAPINYMADESGEYLLYCSDRNSGFGGAGVSDTLTKDKKLDYKIAYLLKNGYPNKNYVSGITGFNSQTHKDTSLINGVSANDLANLWVTQAGLWTLQNTVSDSDKIYATGDGTGFYLESNNVAYTLCSDGTSSATCSQIGGLNLKQYVTSLVNAANSAKDPESTTLNINFDNKWELVDDTYKSSVFELVSSNPDVALNSLSFDLSNAANGTKLYAENGTDLTDSANAITGVTKFYLTIPKSEVSSGNSNFKISTSANITYDAAYQYIDKETNHQPSVLVGPETKQLNNVMSITIVPDTASIISKSIYFVGFILLTFGAGIIYINIKQNNEEV